MARARAAAGGGREIAVAPERLARWLDGFTHRHGPTGWAASDDTVTGRAADGATAACRVPYPPLPPGAGDQARDLPSALVAHALRDRRVGVLLVRLGGHAAGVFEGPRLVVSKVGARHVQGRTAAGGWSQQRFARRRENQGKAAAGAAADVAARVLLPAVGTLDGLVLGGDRRAAAAVLDDPRLAALRGLVVEPFLDVPDPRLRVLEATPGAFRSVRIRVTDGPEGNPGKGGEPEPEPEPEPAGPDSPDDPDSPDSPDDQEPG